MNSQFPHPIDLQRTFDDIAPWYDPLNFILSWGAHILWNRKLLTLLGHTNHLLDLCSGTGIVAVNFLKKHQRSQATMIDFSAMMLHYAKKKHKHLAHRFQCIQADIQQLPLPNNFTDAVTLAYGLRNLKTPQRCFQEIYRVLSDHGRIGILELTSPSSRWVRFFHRLYLNYVVPNVGKWVSKHHQAYQYLKDSIQALPADQELEAMFQQVGFQIKHKKKLLLGTATIWILCK